MSKLLVIFLLTVLMIPAGVFASSPVPSFGAINSTSGTCMEISGSSCCDMMGDNPETPGTTTWGSSGSAVPGCGMMVSGTASGSCGNGSACGCGDDCSGGMMGDNKGTSGTSRCGATEGYQGTLGTTSCPMTGMMGGSWGQPTAVGTGRSGWIVLGFILVIILIIIWIVVGILLIVNLYRKLSTK